MADDSMVRKITKKNINWSGLVSIPQLDVRPNVHARVEKLEPQLLWEKNVLQINTNIKIFVVVSCENNEVQALPNAQNLFTNQVEVAGYINLQHNMTLNDIQYINHNLRLEKTAKRPGQVFVKGVLELEICYLARATLSGMVTEFLTGIPIRDAEVTVRELELGEALYSTTTGNEGKYFFNDIKTGTFQVIASAQGYETQESIAVIMLHDTVNFVLHKDI